MLFLGSTLKNDFYFSPGPKSKDPTLRYMPAVCNLRVEPRINGKHYFGQKRVEK